MKMAGSKRSKRNKGLEPNLYLNGKYYSYKHPHTGKFHGMGTDRAQAQINARMLNTRLVAGADLVSSVMGFSGHTIASTAKAFKNAKIDEHPTLAEGSKKNKTYLLNQIVLALGSEQVGTFRTLHAAEYLDTLSGDKYRQARLVLSQLFDFAITKGWADTNPIIPTQKTDPTTTKKRQRLTVEQFKAIRSAAPDWFAIAMDLSLITCQGRSEIAAMRHSDIKNGILYIVRQKTQKHASARIAAEVTPALADIIGRAKAMPPLSQYIVHTHNPRSADIANNVNPATLSRWFKKVRDTLPVFDSIPMNERPTFHEIRALGAHLLETKEGRPTNTVQTLMGHADESMTEVYLEGHSEKWVPARAGNFTI